MLPTKLRRRAVAALVVALAAAVALGGAELILQDGRVLQGDSARKEDDVYILSTPTGEITMPVELVDGVRLTGEPEPEAPTGFKVVKPGAIVGEEIRPPTAEEQTRAIGNPSKFAPSIVDHEWHPTSAFSDEDVLADSRSTWAKPAIDSSWKPTDGFAKSSD